MPLSVDRHQLQSTLGIIPDSFELSFQKALSEIPLDDSTQAAFSALSTALKASLTEICLCISDLEKLTR